MTDMGGEVRFIYQEPLRYYEGDFSKGIQGKLLKNSDGEGHSIMFIGSHLETTKYF